MYNHSEFLVDTSRIWELIERFPLGTVITAHQGELLASHLVFLTDPQGGPHGALESHIPRADPQCAHIQAGAAGLVVFQGPQGYITSSCFPDRTSAPTWNFAVVHARGQFQPYSEAETARHLARLVRSMEGGRGQEWHLDEISHRFSGMLSRVLGFRLPLETLEAKFKMGQDESAENLAAALAELEHQHPELAALMRELNRGRLD